MNNKTVVIIGAGQAGGELARALRNQQFSGGIILIGEEPFAPYERPPLSKGVILGKEKIEDCQLFKYNQINEMDIDFRGSTRVIRIDREQQKIHTNQGEQLAYDYLVIATGGYARSLPARLVSDKVEKDRVLTLRSMDDALKLKERLVENSRVLIVGGGWLGLEIAASGKQLGCEITVIEFSDRLCARVLPSEISDYLLELHNNNDINVCLNTGLEYIEQEDDSILATTTSSQSISADLVVVCIGLVPNTQLASDAGLAVDNGICTSPVGSTEDPTIFAIGDVARYRHGALGESVRLESWENANMMARACAQKILGQDIDQYSHPWFWSDQHDANIQIVGIPDKSSKAVLRGSKLSNKFCYFYMDETDQHIDAVVAVNSARELGIAKRLMRDRIKVSTSQIMDQSLKLNLLLKQARI